MNRIEFLRNLDKYKGEDHSVFLEHYGILGQKWGQRRWQNADGTFNEAGKERYFGKTNTSEEKIGSKTSDVKDYLKIRNKLLKERTRPDLYEWYRDKNKYLDKQLVRDAKRMDKAAKKMYENQLKDFYDDPNELVADLKSVYRIGGKPDKKLAGIFTKTPEEKEAKRLTKEAKDIEKSFIEKWNGQEYYNSKEIDKWLDKDENKKLEEVYADCMNTAFGDTSEKLKKVFKDYDDDEIGYTSKAAICDALQDTKKLGDLGSEVYWFLTDDGNQGERNSEAYYLNEKGYDRKQIGDMYREAANNLNEGYEVGMRLSQYMNPTVLYLSDKGKKELYQQVNYRWEGKDNYTFNKILEASEGGDFNKNNINIAKNIAKKMAPSCSGKDNTGWFYFNQAIRNLGMTDVDYTDLSSADWNKINAEINKLKK